MEGNTETPMETLCAEFRDEIGLVGNHVHGLKYHGEFHNEQTHGDQHGEMKANIMLAYRHLEDARMRLGKVMQQIQGGVSIYDRSQPQPETKEGATE